jgi:F0F1-type ATP synthase membrane subunit b/b'
MEDMLLSSASVPLTPWVMVNADKIIPMMDRLRDALPDAVQEAKALMDDQDALLEDARMQAIQLIQDAQRNREQLLSESALMQAIHEEADRVRTQLTHELETLRQQTLRECEDMQRTATEEAEVIRTGAREYASSMLNNMEERLSDIHAQVRSGVQQLNDARTREITHRNHQFHQAPPQQPGSMPTGSVRRRPRPKIASQQQPLMSSAASEEEQIQLAMQLLQQQQQHKRR